MLTVSNHEIKGRVRAGRFEALDPGRGWCQSSELHDFGVEVRTGQCFGEKPRIAMERRVLVSSLASGSRRPVALEHTAGRRRRELEEKRGGRYV